MYNSCSVVKINPAKFNSQRKREENPFCRYWYKYFNNFKENLKSK